MDADEDDDDDGETEVRANLPSYICAYCGKPAARSHLQASTASISARESEREREIGY